MISKLIFALAILCVVNASVLSAFDDDTETDVTASLNRCNVKACDSACRRFHMTSGSCVDGRCKCAKSPNTEEKPMDLEDLVSLMDDDSVFSPSDLENSFSQRGDTETDITGSPNRCNVKVCDWLCRKFHKTSGSCVDGRCKCEKSPSAEEKPTELEDLVSLMEDAVDEYSELDSRRACKLLKCNRTCTRRGYEGATCIEGRCKCYNITKKSLPVSELSEDPTERSCNMQACDQLCRRLKFPGGACVNGRCKCDKFFVVEDAVDEYFESATRRFCKLRECNRTCDQRGYEGSRCVNGLCKCYNKIKREDTSPLNDVTSDENEESYNIFRTDEEDAVDEYSELDSRRACKLLKCNRTCTRRGYEGATCIKGRCKCYNITKKSLPVSELSEDPTERSCNMQACDQLCRRLKFPGGTCVNGRCKCDKFFVVEDAVDEYFESATTRFCKLRECNRTCDRRGYEGSRCVNGVCKCYNKIKREDTSPLNDVTSDENEESYNIFRTDEAEEPTAPASNACNRSCNQMCRRQKYAGGWCRFGQCHCY